MSWSQRTFKLTSRSKGCYLVTDEVLAHTGDLIRDYKVGMVNLFMQHTSAGLTLNENWDSDVREDMSDALGRIAPEGTMYRHNAEGDDDMPAHVRSTLVGNSVNIPIKDGKLALGMWQGIWLCEFRRHHHVRTIVATIQGEKK
jgi:secondary thiamine-phosphate synthase enzyme